MTDIAKCAGFKDDSEFRHWCPLRQTCFRYTAKDAGDGQTWMHQEWKVDEFGNVTCDAHVQRKAQ